MNKPKNKLPWKLCHGTCGDGIKPREYSEISTERNVTVISTNWMREPQKEDLEYVVEAANNYPKAVEWVKKLKKHLEIVDEYNHPELNEFLKSINELE